jgi:hypothetical protein
MSCIVLKQMVACPTCRLSKHTCVFSQVKNKLSDTSVVLRAVDRILRVSTALIVYASCSCPAPHYRHCATHIEAYLSAPEACSTQYLYLHVGMECCTYFYMDLYLQFTSIWPFARDCKCMGSTYKYNGQCRRVDHVEWFFVNHKVLVIH